ncbi:LysR family transcriptional regulator [Kerstersia gyiorum]|uniref:LysR family transcriptional regulator n=1 Tax=Kerstersia gyiorum TaxID=206506 RepID=UPI001070D833|nr:LysR family transcriptional regulator [Kerstersia gyiorum]QBR39550.1 LysR family transcriptional regulator [Kerstersia gyiorum]
MTPSERLKGIEAFVATADAGSFTTAAERLHLTGSAVSKGVARLEQRLGTRLFERTTRRLKITDAGAAFYRTCVRVLKDLEEAEAVLAAQRSEPMGRLRLDAPATFGRLRVLPLLLNFAQQHSHLRPHVSLTDRFVDLLDEGIDIAVRIGGPDNWPVSVGHHFLGRERLIFCAAPSYLATKGTPADLDALVQHDAVLYGKADGTTSSWLITRGAGMVEQCAMEPRIVVGNGEAQVAAVKAGFGIAQLATWLVNDEIERGELVSILPNSAADGLPLNLVWPIGRQLLPKVDAMLKLLSGALSIH